MPTRPVFVPSIRRGTLFEEVPVFFEWFPGFSLSQKQKSIGSLHDAARKLGLYPLLEVSTKSLTEVGRRLSAFNLKIEIDGNKYSLESVYQASKVFSESGQHTELLDQDPYTAKRRIRELGSGVIVAFRFMGRNFPTEPKNAFYDWLYIRALQPYESWIKDHIDFYGYTDIEFNPEKSINCQARAVAEYMSLSMQGAAAECYRDFDAFRNVLQLSQRHG